MRSFWPSRAVVLRTGIVFVVIAASAGPVRAQTAGNDALKRARDAWTNGDFDLAPALYRHALDSGGLARADVIDAYAHIGASLGVAKKKRKAALAAFRNAALLDPDFEVPAEAGKAARALADQARQAQSRVGTLSLAMEVPGEVDTGSSFDVDVTVSPGRGTPVAAIDLEARDSLAGRTFEQRASAAPHVHFEVPARMTLPDATLVVEMHARDSHDNELVSTEKRVHVAPAPAAAAAPPAPIAALSPAPSPAPRSANHVDQRPSGSFWSSPWVYVIGGAALAAGGAAVWFATRPTDNVYVGSVHVEPGP